MAPSGGNCQPWKFLHHEGRLALFMDVERAASALDPGLRYAFMELGACAENMALEAARCGFELDLSILPVPEVTQLVAVMERGKSDRERQPDPANVALAAQIPARCTNRKNSLTLELSDDEARELTGAIRSHHPLISLTLVRDRERIRKIAELTGRAERIRFLNPTCHHDMFVREMRWNRSEAESTKDGIDIDTLELSLTDRTGLRIAADQRAAALLRTWNMGHAIEKLASKSILASSALAIFSVPDLSPRSTFAGGQAVERFWLRITELGMIAHPVGAAIFMGIHGNWDTAGILSPAEHTEAKAVLQDLTSLIGATGSQPLFLLRLGRAGEPTARSLRLPLSAMFHSTAPVPA